MLKDSEIESLAKRLSSIEKSVSAMELLVRQLEVKVASSVTSNKKISLLEHDINACKKDISAIQRNANNNYTSPSDINNDEKIALLQNAIDLEGLVIRRK